MPSEIALRAVLAASITLGIADVVWINVALVPDVTGAPPPPPPPRLPLAAGGRNSNRYARADGGGGAPSPPPPSLEPRVVYFATRSDDLDDTARDTLRALAANLPTDATLVLEGHADHRGDESLNRRLSKHRAQAVATELAALGIETTRLRIRYRGETQVMHTADDVWRDRRVEIEIISGGTR